MSRLRITGYISNTLVWMPVLLIGMIGCSNDSEFASNANSDGDVVKTISNDLAGLQPTPIDKILPEEGEDSHDLRRQWIEDIHRCSPDTDWQAINQQNAERLSAQRPNVFARGGTEPFANGQVNGTWVERGGVDQSGAMNQIRYVPQTDQVYGFSGLYATLGGRSLWRGNRDGTGWTVLNDDYIFRSDTLEAFVPNSVSDVRLIVCQGKFLKYTDDQGQTFEDSTFNPEMGFEGFGRSWRMGHLPGSNDTVFYLVRTWDTGPGAYRMWMYRSTDAGENFDRVHVFGESTLGKLDMWLPESGGTAYVLENDSTLHQFSAGSYTTVACNGLPSGQNEYQLAGSFAGGLTLYALINGNDVYKSTNGGQNWSYTGTVPENGWAVGIACSPDNADHLYLGEQECWRSHDSGANWELVNRWNEYYPDNDFLHADIMDFEFGETSSGTPFVLVANHGGLHVSYDDLQTTDNLGDFGLNTGQYYDSLTHPTSTNVIMFGAQDQGWQWTSTANIPGPVSVIQQISGDFGQARLSRNNESYWTQYPGNWFFYYPDSTNPISLGDTFNIDGNHGQGWIGPTAGLKGEPAENSIFVGGGELNDGDGSYLIKLTADEQTDEISGSQYNYDFRANSNSGTARISAIEQSVLDADRIYVTTGDGSFFRTTNGGTSWEKTTGFEVAPTTWIYTSSILGSSSDPDLLWTSGSGYDNPPVFKSMDGGLTFQPMSNGLPDTLVQDIVANPSETLLFAATDIGPFVYVVADDQWYSLLGSTTPISWYTSVEYIERENLVRFATWGRGAWDFEVDFGTFPSDSITVTQGTEREGSSPSALEESDNVDYSVQRSATSVFARVELTAQLVSPTPFPTELTLTLEASVFARSTVSQQVWLYDFLQSSWESVDTRDATRFTDSVANIDVTGDLSRFVDPVSGMMEARVRFTSPVARQRFTANIDQFIWSF